MKKLILFIFLFGLFSCSLSKDKMLGDDIRLWQDTDAWQLAKAVEKGDTTQIDKILKEKKVSVDYKEPRFGQSLLSWGIWKNKTDMVRFLLSRGANPNLHDNYDGQSPMTMASSFIATDINILSALLKYGGNPNDHVLENDSLEVMPSGETPLTYAVRNSMEKVKMLINAGANINLAVVPGRPPLFSAINGGDLEIIKYILINKKANYNNVYTITIDGDTLKFADLLKDLDYPESARNNQLMKEIVHYLHSQDKSNSMEK